VALNKTQLTQDLFAPYFDPNPGAAPKPMYVWVSYSEALLKPPTDACTRINQPNAFGRVQERFALTVTPDVTGWPNDQILVDGKQMGPPVQPPPTPPQPGDILLPNDDSVPYQEFSTDDSAVHWYVGIGRVLWDPHNGLFVKQPDPNLAIGRLYAGDVTTAIFTPDNTLKIRNRFSPNPLPTSPTDLNYGGVAAELAGSLSVDRFVEATQYMQIDGLADPTKPKLSPLNINASGANENLVRLCDPTGIAKWGICEKLNGSPGLNFGEADNSGNLPGTSRLFLAAGGNVGVGVTSPTQNLSVNGGLNIDQATGNNGAGLSPGLSFGSAATEGLASNQSPGGANKGGLDFYTSGVARLSVSGNGNVGIGTQDPRASLDVAGGLLHVGGTIAPVVARQGAYLGWNALTGGTGETDFINNQGFGTGGFAFMNTPPSGSPRSTLMVITGGGSVGIGTPTPAALLDVAGDARVEGSLKVTGNQNVFGVRTFLKALKNVNSSDAFRPWSVDYTNQFEQVYSVFAVFQGFSVFNNENNLNFDAQGHVQGGAFIPQHAFVRVDFFDVNGANGVCYCSESDNTVQSDNSILFTVVVMGRPKF
jgi:hypothetical protein